MPKFCKDCKHCELSTFYNRLSFWPFIKGKPTDKSYANAKCGHPKGVEDNDKERFLTALGAEKTRSHAESQYDVVVGIQRVMEGTDWPVCAAVYCVGMPGSLNTVVQPEGVPGSEALAAIGNANRAASAAAAAAATRPNQRDRARRRPCGDGVGLGSDMAGELLGLSNIAGHCDLDGVLPVPRSAVAWCRPMAPQAYESALTSSCQGNQDFDFSGLVGEARLSWSGVGCRG